MLHFLSFPSALFCTPARLSVAIVVLLGLGLMDGPTVHAQTPITTVENGEGDPRLELFDNGGFLVPGTIVDDGTETDSIPAEGAGVRMMWYPEKAAFRAGQVGTSFGTDNRWDAANIGAYSVAFGRDTEASGNRAVAMGWDTEASGSDAMAMGRFTEAIALSATAIGFGTTASGKYATAMGRDTNASGEFAAAMGLSATASGQGATAMGVSTLAIGPRATSMGMNTRAGTPSSLSLGRYNSSNQFDDGSLLVVGNGSSSSDLSDALVLEDDGDLEIAGSLTENSDRRLKTDIAPLEEGTLDALADIRPVRFQFKDETTHPSGEQIGVIAQEVQAAFPELVSEGSDGYLSVAYPKFTAVLLKGVQEQQVTIETQNQRIDRLEERLEALERGQSSSLPASLTGFWGLALLLGLGGLTAGLLWRRRQV